MNDRMIELDDAQVKAGRAQEMLYAVTAQSHYRAMALLLPTEAAKYNGQVEEAKATFAQLLDELQQAEPANAAFYEDVRTVNEDYRQSGQKVVALIDQGRTDEAAEVHLNEEHPTSHKLEASMRTLIATAKDGHGRRPERLPVCSRPLHRHGDRLLGRERHRGPRCSGSSSRGRSSCRSGRWNERSPTSPRATSTSASTCRTATSSAGLARDLNSTSERLATLFDDQRRLATRLGETNASLERASEAKSRFLANVSHELRTPMTAILGFTDALLAGVDGPLNPDQEASLRWVQRGGQDLLGLINEILDLSKIEAGKLTLDVEPFDPRELVDTVVAQHRSLAAQKGIRFGWHDAGTPAEVVLDRQRVRQILVNLVGNALKFTEAGEVEVTSAADRRRSLPRRSARHRARHLPGAAGGDLRGVPPGRGSRGRHRPRAADQPPPRTSDGRRRHVRERAEPRERLPPRPPARLSPDARWPATTFRRWRP